MGQVGQPEHVLDRVDGQPDVGSVLAVRGRGKQLHQIDRAADELAVVGGVDVGRPVRVGAGEHECAERRREVDDGADVDGRRLQPFLSRAPLPCPAGTSCGRAPGRTARSRCCRSRGRPRRGSRRIRSWCQLRLGHGWHHVCREAAFPVTGPVITSLVRGYEQLIHLRCGHRGFIESNHPVIVRHGARTIKPRPNGNNGGMDPTKDQNAIRQSHPPHASGRYGPCSGTTRRKQITVANEGLSKLEVEQCFGVFMADKSTCVLGYRRRVHERACDCREFGGIVD